MDRTDEELISEYQQGQTEAYVMLCRRYKMPIFNFCLRILNNRADAEDTTADILLTVFQKAGLYRPQAKFSTWMFTLARNACISKLRQAKYRISLWFTKDNSDETVSWDIPSSGPSAAEELIRQETKKQVRDAIQKLPDLQKEALILREYHAMSYQEISGVLQCSVENVKILIFRARERLRTELSSFRTEGPK